VIEFPVLPLDMKHLDRRFACSFVVQHEEDITPRRQSASTHFPSYLFRNYLRITPAAFNSNLCRITEIVHQCQFGMKAELVFIVLVGERPRHSAGTGPIPICSM